MTNDQTWLAGHRAAKKPTLLGAYAAMAVTVVAPFLPSEPLQATAILLGCGLLPSGILYGAVAVSGRRFRTRVRESPIWLSMRALYVRRMCCPRSFHRASGIGGRIVVHSLGPFQAAKSAPSSPVRRD
ncbi:hypothetical protein [Arthrobacter alpinus]|uniref:hypothetical protein n=1 Tax=Arthrobacter alpinus TaxID=656366 RepID=UPI003B58B2D8